VALKVLTPAVTMAPRAVKRFQREAQVAGRLHHTHIVPVYGMGQHGGTWYFAMEFIEGRPLSQILDELRSDSVGHPSRRMRSLFSFGGRSKAQNATNDAKGNGQRKVVLGRGI
jgi:serine/threonine protein kinase